MKKILFLVVTLVLVMGTLGIAYSMWSSTIKINAQIGTDDVKWCFSTVTVSDPCSPGTLDQGALGITCASPLGGSHNNPAELKNVACETATIDPKDCHNLSWEIDNAYPFYYGEMDFSACNYGSVPVKVCSVTLSDGITTWTICGQVTRALDLNGDGQCDMLIWWGDSFGNQIDPSSWTGQDIVTCADISVHFAFLENLEQNHSTTNTPPNAFHFTLTMKVTEWNEACNCTPTSTVIGPP